MKIEAVLPYPSNWFRIRPSLGIARHVKKEIKWGEVELFDYIPSLDRRVSNIVISIRFADIIDIGIGKLYLAHHEDGLIMPEWTDNKQIIRYRDESVFIIREIGYETS